MSSAEAPAFAHALQRDPLPLGDIVVLNCFYNCGQAVLGRLFTHYKVDAGLNPTLFEKLHALLTYFLPDADEQTLLEILAQRVDTGNDSIQWTSFDFGAVIEDDDAEELHKQEEQEKTEQQEK